MNPINHQMEMVEFIHRAQLNGYAGHAQFEINPERPGFKELTYNDGDWSYRDSFTGWFKSRGMEVVRYNLVPVWASMYGGGMVNTDKRLAHLTFEFLKQVLAVKEKGFISFRGPEYLQLGSWEYHYHQEGDVAEFWGDEAISRQKKIVFQQKVMGGQIQQVDYA